MINKMCKTGGFKLPHMSKSPVAYHEKGHMVKAEKPKIKAQKTEEEKMAEARKALDQISQKPLLEPKPLKPEMRGPINFSHDKNTLFAPAEDTAELKKMPAYTKDTPQDALRKMPSFHETFTNSSGNNPEEFKAKYRDSVADSIEDKRLANFIKNMEVLDNPEYASYTKKLNPESEVFGKYDPEAEPARSSEYDFFVKHRTPESDRLAYNMMDLNDQMNEARKNRDSDKIRELYEKSKNLRSVVKNAGRVMEEGGKSEYLEDKMNLRGQL